MCRERFLVEVDKLKHALLYVGACRDGGMRAVCVTYPFQKIVAFFEGVNDCLVERQKSVLRLQQMVVDVWVLLWHGFGNER